MSKNSSPDTLGIPEHPGPVTMVEPPECLMRYPAGWGTRSCANGCRSEHACVARQQWHQMLEKVRAA